MKQCCITTCLLLLQLTLFAPLAGQHIPYIQYLDDPWVDSVMNSLSTREQIAQLVWIMSDACADPAQVVAIDHLISEVGIGGVVFSQVATREDLDVVDYYRSIGRVPLVTGIMSGAGDPFISGRSGDFPDLATLASIADDSLLREAGIILGDRLSQGGFQMLLAPPWEGGMGEANIAEAFREHRLLITSSYLPGPAGAALEREIGWMPGFREVIATDAAATAGLAFCFAADAAALEHAIEELEAFARRGTTEETIITHRARMVLAFKYWAGLYGKEETAASSSGEKMAASSSGEKMAASSSRDKVATGSSRFPMPLSQSGGMAWEAMLRELYASSLTVLTNRETVIPVQHLDQIRVATLAINASTLTPFQRMAGRYTRMDHYHWMPGASSPASLPEQLRGYDLVLAAVYPGTYTSGEMEQLRDLIQRWGIQMGEKPRLIATFFGGVDELVSTLPAMLDPDGLILAYQHNEYTEELAAQLIFGGIGARGRLPVSIGAGYPAGSGLETPGGLRLQYAFPENAGVSSYRLQKAIDSIVNAGLRAGAFPGCEVMAARRGMVIFHQTYGHHTYDRRIAVEEGDLYDLASVTKVSGPLSGLMWLEGAGKFSHEEKLGTYCPEMKRSDKASLPLKDILAHQAGLYPWIPYWQDAVRTNGEYRRRFLRYAEERRFPLTVADHLYLKYNFNRKIFKTIRKSELGERTYLYSGLAFFLFPGIIEDLSGERYEDFLYRHIYHRIGAWDLVFNPTRFYSPRRIVPTEYDSTFRKQQVHGYVHDEGAAMMGGYSGNAGLFATAGDLMKLMEMYRRMGTYGGEQIIPAGVLREYTSYQFPETKNRRGLGFDKPLLDERDGTPADYPCPGASPSSFGHSGFTGTFVWVDPEAEITYVFLSNRVYPTRENNLISEMDIRTSILQGIYDAIDSSD